MNGKFLTLHQFIKKKALNLPQIITDQFLCYHLIDKIFEAVIGDQIRKFFESNDMLRDTVKL